MKTTTRTKTWFFLIMSALFLLQDKLQDWFQPFQYFDEAFGLLIVPMVLIRLCQRRLPLRWTRKDVILCAGLLTFWLFGWAGHLRYQYQPLSNALKDSYVNIKFFLALGGSFLFFDDPKLDFSELKKKLWPCLNAATLILFVLCVVDLLFGVFSDETRGGLRIVKLFYSAYTYLVSGCVFLSCLYLWYYDWYQNKIIPPLLMLCFILFSTGRVKAVGAMACILLIYLFILRRQPIGKKIRILAICIMVFAVGAGLFQVFFYYISLGTESARAMLTLASPFVAWDHFPFGSGWATFASAFSAEPYSPVYGQYRMAGIWGISPEYHQFMSDTYWPMILGETGFFGFAAFIAALVVLIQKFFVLKDDHSAMAGAANALLYLLISSTSESAFANPMAVPLAFWLGFLLARHHQERGVR